MILFDSIKMAFGSLWAKKTRSFLSMLGVVIGILTISSLLSIGFGVKAEVGKQIEDLGTNLVVVISGKQESGGGVNISASLGQSTLVEEDFLAIKNEVPDAQNLSMMNLISGTIKRDSKPLDSVVILGGSPGVESAFNFKLKSGRFLNQGDENLKTKNVVIGENVAARLFPSEDPLGKVLTTRSTSFNIVGVLEKRDTASNLGGPDFNSLVMMPIRTSWNITGNKQIFRISMQAKDSESINSLKSRVKTAVLDSHKGEEDFSVLSQDDLLGTVNGILNILTAMLGAISAISLLVGGIGIMNIMLVSVSERTREIGIRKAVGATSGNVLLQFLIESAILTMLGGLLAVGVFAAGVMAVPKDFPIPITLDPFVLLLALGFSALVGVVFGIIPAIGAARKNPIDALRYE